MGQFLSMFETTVAARERQREEERCRREEEARRYEEAIQQQLYEDQLDRYDASWRIEEERNWQLLGTQRVIDNSSAALLRNEEDNGQRQIYAAQRAEQFRQQQLLEAKRKEKERRRHTMEEEEQALKIEIDFFIRTRRKFSSAYPLEYACPIVTIANDANVRNAAPTSFRMPIADFICREPSFVVHPNTMTVSVRYRTPFQGDTTHRVYGKFKCSNCQRTWESAGSWKNRWQKCQNCDTKAYPYWQNILEISEDKDNSSLKPHDIARCEECVRRRRLCLPNTYYAI